MQAWLTRTIGRSAGCAIILDEFACNRLVYRLHDADLAGSVRSSLVRLLFRFYPSCNVHWILKTVPVAIAAQRISRRPMLNNRAAKPVETLPAARTQTVLTQHTQLSQFMYDAIRARFAANVHGVDGVKPVDAQVSATRELLVGLLSDRRAAGYACF
jgi:hypothetical protein